MSVVSIFKNYSTLNNANIKNITSVYLPVYIKRVALLFFAVAHYNNCNHVNNF